MSSEINYKQKYQELKLKYMNSVDMAFRLGYEQGVKDSQVSQMEQAQQQAQEQEAAMAAQGQEGEEDAEGQEGGQAAPGEEAPADSAHPDGSELDQHINKLESMLGKNEVFGDAKEDLKKSLASLKNYKLALDMKKAEKAIKNIGKSMKRPAFSIGKKANANLPEPSKKAVNMQEKIVGDIMKSWEKEEKNAAESIKGLAGLQNLIKKN